MSGHGNQDADYLNGRGNTDREVSELTLQNAPIGTKAPSIYGGHWSRTERGWKWSTGDTFPCVGGDWNGELIPPTTQVEAAAPEAKPAETEAAILLRVIQRLNGNPYNLTKSECVYEVEQMRDAALSAQAAPTTQPPSDAVSKEQAMEALARLSGAEFNVSLLRRFIEQSASPTPAQGAPADAQRQALEQALHTLTKVASSPVVGQLLTHQASGDCRAIRAALSQTAPKAMAEAARGLVAWWDTPHDEHEAFIFANLEMWIGRLRAALAGQAAPAEGGERG